MTNSVTGSYVTHTQKKKTNQKNPKKSPNKQIKRPKLEMKRVNTYKILGVSKFQKYQGNMN